MPPIHIFPAAHAPLINPDPAGEAQGAWTAARAACLPLPRPPPAWYRLILCARHSHQAAEIDIWAPSGFLKSTASNMHRQAQSCSGGLAVRNNRPPLRCRRRAQLHRHPHQRGIKGSSGLRVCEWHMRYGDESSRLSRWVPPGAAQEGEASGSGGASMAPPYTAVRARPRVIWLA